MAQTIQRYLTLFVKQEQYTWMILLLLLVANTQGIAFTGLLLTILSVVAALNFKDEWKAILAIMFGVLPSILLLLNLGYGWVAGFSSIVCISSVLAFRRSNSIQFYFDVQLLSILSCCLVLLLLPHEAMYATIVEKLKLIFAEQAPNMAGIEKLPSYILGITINTQIITLFASVMLYAHCFTDNYNSLKTQILSYRLGMLHIAFILVLMILFYFQGDTFWLGTQSLVFPLMAFLPLAFIGSLLIINTVIDTKIKWLIWVISVMTVYILLTYWQQLYLFLAFLGLVDYFFDARVKLIKRKV